jgi:hypothetical protein
VVCLIFLESSWKFGVNPQKSRNAGMKGCITGIATLHQIFTFYFLLPFIMESDSAGINVHILNFIIYHNDRVIAVPAFACRG